MVQYHKLIEVKFFHLYYNNYSSKDLEIVASSNTLMHLKSFNLLFKQTQEGFIILYPDEKKYLLEKLKSEVLFNFYVKAKNKYFSIFSNVSSSSYKFIHAFSNKELGLNSMEDGKSNAKHIKLHLDDYVNENSLILRCYNSVIVNELLEDDEVIIKHNNDIYFDGQLNGRENFGEILGSYYGNYEVTLKNLNKTVKLVYLPSSYEMAFCMMEFSVGGELTSFDEVKGLNYVVRFESRAILWNYFFVSKESILYKKVSLYSGKEKMPFSEPKQVELVNGQRALKVTSELAYHLKHRYFGRQFFAELEKDSDDENNDNRKKTINLATPDVTRIKGKRTKDAEIYFSDMYIYL